MTEKRVDTGVYQTYNARGAITGWRVYVRVGGTLRTKLLPITLSLGDVKRWREDFVSDLRRDRLADLATVPGGFAEDAVKRYLPAVAAMPSIQERTRHILLWVDEFGDAPRTTIKPVQIRAVRDRWLLAGPKLVMRKKTAAAPARWEAIAAPLSASQVNKRLRALENLWTVLDGRHAYNPVREVPEADEGDREPRALPWSVVEAILAAMPDRGRGAGRTDGSQTKARLRVMAWTGLSQAHLMRLTPSDIDLRAGTLFLRRRKKGRALERRGRTIPLLPQGVAAFREFAALNCWGRFSISSMWKSFQRAAARAGYSGLRPYDFRHTFATMTVQAADDLDLASELLGHASSATTKHYTAAALNPRILAAFERMKAKVRREVTTGVTKRTRKPAPSTVKRGRSKPF